MADASLVVPAPPDEPLPHGSAVIELPKILIYTAGGPQWWGYLGPA